MNSTISPRTSNTANVVVLGGVYTQVHGDSHSYHIDSDDDREVIKDRFSRLDYNLVQQEMISKRAEGTGNWFLQSLEYRQWVDDPSVKLLWCPGGPGVGKTIISAISVDYLFRLQKGPVCFVYLNYKQAHQQNLYTVFGSILRQLYELKSTVTDKIHDFGVRNQNMQSVEILDLLREVGEQMGTFYLVVDGLNEYLEDYKDEPVKELITQLMLVPNLKVMVTSRVLSRMNSIFGDHGAVEIRIKSSYEDLGHYITSRLSETIPFASKIHEDILKRVLEAAQERFLVAELHLNTLTKLPNIRQIQQYLQTVSADVELVYSQIYSQVQQQTEDRRKIANRVLIWVASTRRSLYVEELQHALVIDEGWDGTDDIEDYIYPIDLITSVCLGLVELTSTNKVQFIHHTVQAFVEKILLCGENPHTYVSRSLLRYLSPRINDINDHLKWNPLTWPKGWKYPLLLYIASHWRLHITGAGHTLFSTRQAFERESSTMCTAIHLSSFLADSPKMSPYHWLIENQDLLREIETLPSLIRPSGEPFQRCGISLIHLAAALNLPHIIQSLFTEAKSSLVLTSIVRRTISTIRLGIRVLTNNKTWTVNSSDTGHNHDSPLITAARFGSTDAAHVILSAIDAGATNFDVNARSSNTHQTALSVAAEFGFVDVVKLFLSRGDVDIEACGTNTYTPLMQAVHAGHDLVVKELLKSTDIRVDGRRTEEPGPGAMTTHNNLALQTILRGLGSYTDFESPTVLQTAIRLKRKDIVETLMKDSRILQEIPPPHSEKCVIGFNGRFSPEDPRNPLTYALITSSEPVVLLLSQYIPYNIRFREPGTRRSLLAIAANRGFNTVVRALLKISHRLRNLVDVEGLTPLLSAAEQGHTQVVKTLLDAGVRFNIRGPNKATPLILAAGSPSPSCVKAFLQLPDVDCNAMDKFGNTPLHCASARRILESVKLLLEAGAQPNAINKDGNTPLLEVFSRAGSKDILAVVKELVSHSADVDSQNPKGMTALSIASWTGSLKVVKALLELGANHDIADNLGHTPIFHAVMHNPNRLRPNRRAVIKLLLRNNASLNAQDFEGRTPLDYAREENDPEIIELLGSYHIMTSTIPMK